MDLKQLVESSRGGASIQSTDQLVVLRNGEPRTVTGAAATAGASTYADAAATSAAAASDSADDAQASAESIDAIPTLPGSGTHTLKCVDGAMAWVEDT